MSAVKIKNRHRLKNKEIKKIQNELKKTFDYEFFDERSSVETGDVEGMRIIFVDDEPVFMIYENRIIFTLQGLYKYKPKENFVVIDMGAVKFVTSGADIMAPGIVDADKSIYENDQVWICDERHHKPLAVGIAIMTGEQMISERQGRAIKVIHYVGDSLWNFTAKSL
jgi:PUA domain protein